MLLYMAARSQLVHDQIKPSLESGKTVICDRYLLANVVYQGSAGGLSINDLWSVGKVATSGVSPDITILLDLEPDLAAKRIIRGADRLEKRGIEYFRKVREGFVQQHSRASKHSFIVDASQSVEQIQIKIQEFVSSCL